jgi:hypothetical protein
MEQRPLRLGDIVDDYCPRERRITNHAIVVLTGPDIHSTRCTTCDAEHPYKKARMPLRRAKDGADGKALEPQLAPRVSPPAKADATEPAVMAVESGGVAVAEADAPETDTADAAPDAAEHEVSAVTDDPAEAPATEGAWTHRPLIRASLPRTDQPPAPRPLPDFTIRNLRHRDQRFTGRSRHSR